MTKKVSEVSEENPKEQVKKAIHSSLKDAVNARIATSGPDVFEAVAQAVAQEEITKRIGKVTQYYTEVDNINRDLKKVKAKADVITYDIDGKVVSEAYTKETTERVKKLKERKVKVEKALEEALVNNNYDLLNNLGDGK